MLGFVSVAFAQDGVTPEADYDAMIATFAGYRHCRRDAALVA